MPQTFVALQCAFCSTFSAQLDKKSKKFCCAICGQQQSFRTVFAVSNSGKDIRLVVQQLNELRGTAEAAPPPAEVLGQQPQQWQQPGQRSSSGGSGQRQLVRSWDAFAAEQADGSAEQQQDDWEEGGFVTALPDWQAATGKRAKTSSAGGEQRRGQQAPPSAARPPQLLLPPQRQCQQQQQQQQQQASRGGLGAPRQPLAASGAAAWPAVLPPGQLPSKRGLPSLPPPSKRSAVADRGAGTAHAWPQHGMRSSWQPSPAGRQPQLQAAPAQPAAPPRRAPQAAGTGSAWGSFLDAPEAEAADDASDDEANPGGALLFVTAVGEC